MLEEEAPTHMAQRGTEHYVVSDLHGYPDALLRLLREQRLVDGQGRWSAAHRTLWLLGDYVDHGPDGVGVIDLVMQLEEEAAGAGGRVIALLGNHDLLLLAAKRFAEEPHPGGGTYLSNWRESHGQQRDLEALSSARAGWLSRLPLIARQEDTVLVHADSSFYGDHGTTVEAIDNRLRGIVQGDDRCAWETLLSGIDRHRAYMGPDGEERVARFLELLGARQLVHGHTPIAKITKQPPAAVRAPYRYAGGTCLNIDGGIYLGGGGIILAL